MKGAKIVLACAAAGLIGAAAYGLYRIGVDRGMQMAAPAAAHSVPAASAAQGPDSSGKRVLYWHDPMVPGHKFDKPGKSPFMDMELVPVYADEKGDEGMVAISPRMQQNLGIRTADVAAGSLAASLEAVGTVGYNERDVVLVQARSNGFIEKLHVRAPLDRVRKGQALAQLYAPDWLAAQEEYLTVKRMRGAAPEGLLDAARRRMRLAGMNEEQIRSVESSGIAQTRFTIAAPASGVIAELNTREGMTVTAGAPLFRINGLGTVWVNAAVPENLAAQLQPGDAVEARTPALPGVVLTGKVNAILPEIDAATRTLKARIELANPADRLVPGMFVTLGFRVAGRNNVLTIPSEAVIRTGKRSVVIVAQGEGQFAPVDVEAGMEGNGRTEIRKGLEVGQKVVVSGQFLIDSEASLKGIASRMGGAGEAAAPDAGKKAGAAQ